MLETVDLSVALDRDTYVTELTRYQLQLRELGYQVYMQKRPVVVAYEGWDAAGKGGNIKRVTEKLDPRGYSVYPISAPQGEDKTHHYLYRFWRRLPERGQIAIFDRSWYGRVMVERIEGFATEEEWQRAYGEILISHATYQGVQGVFDMLAAGQLRVRGRGRRHGSGSHRGRPGRRGLDGLRGRRSRHRRRALPGRPGPRLPGRRALAGIG